MKWHLFICSDCDEDDGVMVMQVPDNAGYDPPCPVDYCPGCNSYLSLLGKGDVKVNGNALVHLRLRDDA